MAQESEPLHGVSYSTLKNWDRLNAQTEGRLTSRANKRKSKKRVLPLEYISNAENVPYVLRLLDEIDEGGLDIFSVIKSVGLKMLEDKGIGSKAHVVNVLKEYEEIGTVDGLLAAEVPGDEFDILGVIYQSYLQEGTKNMAGSYYTPRRVAGNMTASLDLSHGETFLDPCCGGGAYLLALNAEDPEQLYGADNDAIAVFIAKVNLLLKYRDREFVPQIYCLDFLAGSGAAADQRCPVFQRKYNYIATNPPWGAMKGRGGDCPCITSRESFSCFFVRAFGLLKQGGIIRFLFPESILKVRAHRDIRRFILEETCLMSITLYDESFTGVTTKYVDIECSCSGRQESFVVHRGRGIERVRAETMYETENLVFNLLTDTDSRIVQTVKSRGRYTLRDSVWALGIVTGDNKGKLSRECLAGMEPIYTGKEIRPYVLLPAKKYIVYDRSALQQAAKDEIYRAPEKLVYKFISSRLVFALDSSGSLFLNSANILIPRIPHMSMKTVMAFLNSALFQFMYTRLFGEVKILKGNLMELPFPDITEENNQRLTALADAALAGDFSKIQVIDDVILSMYQFSDEDRMYIKRTVQGDPGQRT